MVVGNLLLNMFIIFREMLIAFFSKQLRKSAS